jgi:hypothetical protein
VRYFKVLLPAVAIVVFGGVSLARAQGNASKAQETILKFSNPVQVPGMVLPAGRYLLRLAEPSTAQQMVEIWNGDQTKLYETVFALPIKRSESAEGKLQVTLAGNGVGNVPAIRSWFDPGHVTGFAFVYPSAQATMIAQTTKQVVLTSDDADPYRSVKLGAARFYTVDQNGVRKDYEWAGMPAAKEAAQQPWSDARLAETHLTTANMLVNNALRGNRAVATSGTTGTAMVSMSRADLRRIDRQLQEARQAIERIERR